MSIIEKSKEQQHHFIGWNGDLADSLLLVSLRGQESLSSPYQYELRSLTKLKEADLARWHGEAVSCRIGDGSQSLPQRHLHGVVTRIRYAQRTGDEVECIFTLEPTLSLLHMGRMMRIWQNTSVPDLVSTLLKSYGINDVEVQLHGTYPKREYCVQYRESALRFIQRILQEEGIYYFFRHSAAGHTLVLADHPASHTPIGGEKLAWHHQGEIITGGTIDSWEASVALLPASVAIQGFNMPQTAAIDDLKSARSADKSISSVTFTDITPQGERELITRQAQTVMAAKEANIRHFAATANAHWLSCGEIFTLSGHPSGDKAYNIQRLDLEAVNNFDDNSSACFCQLQAVANDQPWVPAANHPLPEIPGVLTATVVGPASEEIHADEYGRIKIHFPWDKENPNDDTCSCWVQVVQPWSGANFGAQFLPRVGCEVLVSFVQGHPDFPVVIGTVHNGQNKPPFALPAGKNESGFVSRSTPKGSVDEGHRLSFNDKKGEELLTIIAQKDLALTVKNDATSTIAANRSTELTKGNDLLVLKEGDMSVTLEKGNWQQRVTGNASAEVKDGDYTLSVTGNATTEVKDGEYKLSVAGNTTTEVKDGEYKLSVAGNTTTEVKDGNYKLSVAGNNTTELKSGNYMLSVSGGSGGIKTDKALTFESTQGIELKVGSNKISLSPSGITINGTLLTLEAKATAELKGAMATVSGSGMTQVSGGIINIG
ncbi:type VI secretion system Vgr family protein [Kosakonia oryzae]|uniref:Type VI secretion system secreted protein VgrG n=1 Tax=Kosakonia oryzae TaxID=497725 RepID=A0AA94H2W5_9ENTR|nr:type VI secretion system tip protein TssI/VgrG [Kosakonia oryzae]ANI82676.1 type VI secretion system tip protein VgrG [Kosakonia oryzae]SFC24640.1 type VI secretion system secreted protein VgrG [Kosakonia oryzae]